MLWYSNNIRTDEKELIETVRDIAEYMMSFVNPEAVRRIKDSREGENSKISSVDPHELAKDMLDKNSEFMKDFKDAKKGVGFEQTNNNKELKEDVNFESSLFDVTKEY